MISKHNFYFHIIIIFYFIFELKPKIMSNFLIYLYPLTSTLGFIFNLISFIVFSRKKFQSEPLFSVFYRLLIIFSTMSLFEGIIIFLWFNNNYQLMIKTKFLCKSISFLIYSMRSLSIWLIVLISIDRMICLIKPALFSIKTNIKIFSSIFLLVFSFIYYGQIFFNDIIEIDFKLSNHLHNHKLNLIFNMCKFRNGSLINTMDLFGSIIVPFILIAVSNLITLYLKYKKNNNNNRISNRNNISLEEQEELVNEENMLIYTSVVLSLIHLATNFLFFIIRLLASNYYFNLFDYYSYLHFGNSRSPNSCLILITFLIYQLNFGSIFFINLIFNRMFRDELITIWRINKRMLDYFCIYS